MKSELRNKVVREEMKEGELKMKLSEALISRVWLVESFADSCGIAMEWIESNHAEYEDAWQDWSSDLSEDEWKD